MIPFIRYKALYFLISLVVIAVGFFYIFRYGITISIDFQGGSTVEYALDKPVDKGTLKGLFEEEGVKVVLIATQGKNVYAIRSFPMDQNKEDAIRSNIGKTFGIKEVKQLRFETVGPAIGKETIEKTGIAVVVAIIGILLYMTYAFKKVKHGLAAILAMLHDLCVLVGVYAIVSHHFGAQLDILFVTATLTTLSFSVHDTIIVFDKIREYQRSSRMSIEEMANKALAETMVRSINNSLTIILMLVPLVLFGGEVIRFFAAALLIGAITGVYSSPFIATPLLVILEEKFSRR